MCVCFSPALDLNGNPWVPYCVAQIVTLLIWGKIIVDFDLQYNRNRTVQNKMSLWSTRTVCYCN